MPPIEPHDPDEVMLTARGIATAVSCEGGLTDIQAELLGAIASVLTGVTVDYRSLEPLGPEEFADVLAARDLAYRQRIVHHMVLGEMVLKPLPPVVAHRVAEYVQHLGVQDDFVRVARRYAEGAYGLAWMDLQRNGFVDHVRDATGGDEAAKPMPGAALPFEPAKVDPEVSDRWAHFEELPEGTLGRGVWELYDGRGFVVPGCPGGAPEYLAQHDFVHVLADYGTNLKGELEVFAFIGRADPDPKGFAWLATLVGLFETGFIADTGFFERDIRERNIQAPGMHERLADSIRRGKVVCEAYGVDLFDVDYHELAPRPLEEVREMLRFPPKSVRAVESGWPGTFDVAGMSEIQRQHAASRGEAVNRNFSQSISVRISDPEKAAKLLALQVEWDHDQATGDIMGYMGGKILQDREDPDVYVIVADFGIVDPDVSAYEEAIRNNDRPKTQLWHQSLLELVDEPPSYREFDELYRTG